MFLIADVSQKQLAFREESSDKVWVGVELAHNALLSQMKWTRPQREESSDKVWVGVELAHKLSQMNGPDLCDHSSAIRALTTRGRHPIVLGSPLAQLNVDSN